MKIAAGKACIMAFAVAASLAASSGIESTPANALSISGEARKEYQEYQMCLHTRVRKSNSDGRAGQIVCRKPVRTFGAIRKWTCLTGGSRTFRMTRKERIAFCNEQVRGTQAGQPSATK